MLLPSGHVVNNDHQAQKQLTKSQQTQQTQQCSSPKLSKANGSITNGSSDVKKEIAEQKVAEKATNLTTNTSNNKISQTNGGNINWDLNRHLDILQDSLKDGWTAHSGKDGRLYYCNHLTRSVGWIPPCENWGANEELPYGWEKAVDSKGRSYFINHLNKTATYEAPDFSRWHDETPPEPRVAVLKRSSTMGFGFVAGSERPVIVRFVTDGGPSVSKLQPGDQILAVNGEDVKEAPRDHVIQLVRACDDQVTLVVCQPCRNSGGPGRKSTLLSAGKRAKLKSRPSRVRFAESVCVNGAPLFPPSAFSLGDLCVPTMANVLKVFLENGQTKSFKYDATTTVQGVVTSLRGKLCLNASEHFSLVLEHVKSLKRNKLTLLDPDETLARIAARPGAHKLRCLFRVTFVPVSAADLAQKDLNALDYLYMQCCNDVTQERFAPELQPDVALRLAALHMHQHALANNVSPAKLTVKIVEREFGLERFVPSSLIEGMKRKELRRLIAHFLKLNSQMTGSSTKMLTQLQAKIHYLDIISTLPSYGAKCFSTNQREGVERVLLISPRFGLSQISGVRNSVPQPISTLEEISRVLVHREDDISCTVHVQLLNDRIIKFSMEDRDAVEFSLVLAGYHKLLTGKELPVDREREKYDDVDNAPAYLSQHTVFPAKWSYLLPYHNSAHNISFIMPPPYHSLQEINALKIDDGKGQQHLVDRNMNNSTENNNKLSNNVRDIRNDDTSVYQINGDGGGEGSSSDDYGLDLHSVMAMELLEEAAKDCSSISGGSSSSGGGSSYGNTGSINSAFIEAKNQEVLRRVAEMQKMVESSEQYLNEHGELIHEYEMKSGLRHPWNSTSLEIDSDCESLNSSKVSSNEDGPGQLKHSDSLVLLAETINQDLSGITQGLNSICGSRNDGRNPPSSLVSPQQTTPKSNRKLNGLSQLLSDLQALGNDCSQSESDSESVPSPTYNKRSINFNSNDQNFGNKKVSSIRTSFGLHSPDSSILMGPETKDNNLREYLRQLKELSKVEIKPQDHTDLAAQKLSELYGFDVCGETLIETDADMIDLRALPPPQTPDELDAPLSVLNAAPHGFDNSSSGNKSEDEGDLDKFLAKVIVAPPTQRATPAKELTPEEIMSFIIPPPPNLNDVEKRKSLELQIQQKNVQLVSDSKIYGYSKENLYSNSTNVPPPHMNNNLHVIEYPTVERKGAFSCCTKNKDDSPDKLELNDNNELQLPPRRCTHIVNSSPPPARPPKNIDLKPKSTNSPVKRITFDLKRTEMYPGETIPPCLPPRDQLSPTQSPSGFPPKKPPLPPIAVKPILRNPHPLPKPSLIPAPGSPIKISGMNSPHFHRNFNAFREIDTTFSSSSSPTSSPSPITSNSSGASVMSPLPRSNGHFRSNSDSPSACVQKNTHIDNKSQLSLLCSPQLSRKTHDAKDQPVGTLTRNGFVVNGEALMAKTDIAMAGLLVKLDQIAAQCTAAQAAGGGSEIDENKFQRAREELTEQTLQLVTASKLLVVAMSDSKLNSLPEHLTSCLTAIRRITELTQDITKHTSSPLQTRNIVLKVHDVASSFRELAGVQIGVLGAGPLALQAECLAGVLTTLLRSLRVFSP